MPVTHLWGPLGPVRSRESPANVEGNKRKQRETLCKRRSSQWLTAGATLMLWCCWFQLCVTCEATRKCEPNECRGFDSPESTADPGKCQCVNMFKGYASSVTCVLADAKQGIIGTDTSWLSERTKSRWLHTHTHTGSFKMTFGLFMIFLQAFLI